MRLKIFKNSATGRIGISDNYKKLPYEEVFEVYSIIYLDTWVEEKPFNYFEPISEFTIETKRDNALFIKEDSLYIIPNGKNFYNIRKGRLFKHTKSMSHVISNISDESMGFGFKKIKKVTIKDGRCES